MRLLLAYWNELRMYRAIWHRKQHDKLCSKVGDYLADMEGRYGQ